MSDGMVDLAVTLATSADRQLNGGYEDRVPDHQGLQTGVRTSCHLVRLAICKWVIPRVDDDDAQTNALPW